MTAEARSGTPGDEGGPEHVIASFIAAEVGYESPGMVEQARDLIEHLAAAGWTLRAAAGERRADTEPTGPLRALAAEWTERVTALRIAAGRPDSDDSISPWRYGRADRSAPAAEAPEAEGER